MEQPKRKPNRLDGYDYSQEGLYFITICTRNKEKLFGEIVGEDIILLSIQLTPCGEVVQFAILHIQEYYPHVFVDVFVIMPNHIHLLLEVQAPEHGRICYPPLQYLQWWDK